MCCKMRRYIQTHLFDQWNNIDVIFEVEADTLGWFYAHDQAEERACCARKLCCRLLYNQSITTINYHFL